MIAWFARNGVAANLLMAAIFAWGLHAVFQQIPLEVFPSFELDVITVRVPFLGAAPAEVEEGVTVKIEEAIYDLEGIKELRSSAAENLGTVIVNVAKGYNARLLMDDIKQQVDAVSTFPDDTERPIISIAKRKRDVISVVISGNTSERELRRWGGRVRDDLVNLPEITQVELKSVRPYEVSIEIPERTLRQYGLTLAEAADAIKKSSLDLPAGAIKSTSGEILLRTKGQAYRRADFEPVALFTDSDGRRVSIADIGQVRDGFSEDPLKARFNNRPCIELDVFRVGDQSAIVVADAVKKYIEEIRMQLPAGLEIVYWRDRSRIVKARLNTLLQSALQGGLLILLLLTLFLRWSIAFWVFIGVPICFMGGLAMMPMLGVTINIISLFAFILVLGIVVDDAIVTGESIYTHMKQGSDATEAAIRGTYEVAVPVTFGVLTTVAAFLPLSMIEGHRGQIFAQIPLIVIPVLLFSLVESKLILPSHLKHVNVFTDRDSHHSWPVRMQRRIADGLEQAIIRLYRPLLTAAMHWRYLTLSLFVGTAVFIFTLVISGHLRFIFFPKIQSELARASLIMPAGTPFDITDRHIERMTLAAEALQEKYIDPKSGNSVIQGIMAVSGTKGHSRGSGESHVGRVMFEIMPPEERSLEITSSQLVQEWRQRIGAIPGAREVNYRAEIGHGGNPIDIQISGNDFADLRVIAKQVKAKLREYPSLFDISDSFEDGKEEIQLQLKPQAELLGLTLSDLARQVRQAFFGFEVQRIQRGRDEVKVMLRYPLAERRSVESLEQMRIRVPGGTAEIPFAEVAEARFGRGFSSITRVDRTRTINIRADANKEQGNIEAIKQELNDYVVALIANYPGVRFSPEGEAREQREAFGSLRTGIFFVLFILYALLAIPFRSYLQPLMVMSVIPFGLVSAILGHLIMGMSLSIMSIMGMLALCGVVINDSLVLVDYVNRRRREGISVHDSIERAGVARFRPVLLTSLTTFAGLTPLILEKTTQAQFLMPMAVSLGFGVLFATFVTLLLIPVNYLILEDLTGLFRSAKVLFR